MGEIRPHRLNDMFLFGLLLFFLLLVFHHTSPVQFVGVLYSFRVVLVRYWSLHEIASNSILPAC